MLSETARVASNAGQVARAKMVVNCRLPSGIRLLLPQAPPSALWSLITGHWPLPRAFVHAGQAGL